MPKSDKLGSFMKIVLLLIFSICTLSLNADDTQLQKFTYESYGESLNYRLYTPKNLPKDKKIPVVLFLHGAGERGTDNTKQLKHGVKSIINYSIANNQSCFLIAPQCPPKKQWANIPWPKTNHTMPEFPSTPLKLALELLVKKIKSLPIDTNRIYITGMSMGGYGTWDALSRKPRLFTAALPLCGGGDVKQVSKFESIPIQTVHGDADRAVPVENSRQMIRALKTVGAKPLYIEKAGVGHDVWTSTYNDRSILDWLFSQKK